MTELPPPIGPPVTTPPGYVAYSSQPTFAPEREPHPSLPIRVAVGAMVVLTVSLIASKYALNALVDYGWPILVYVAMLGLLAYGPSLVWLRYASKRWGTGDVFADVGLEPKLADFGWGPVVWLSALGTQILLGAIVIGLGLPLSNNTDGVGELANDRTYVIAIVVTAVIAAPFVEEMVFRGLVMRGLRSRLPAVVAVGLQAILFGVAHIDPAYGSGNVGLVVVLSGVGTAFGTGAYLLRRIGPTIVAHAIFNGVVLLLVLTNVVDRLQNAAW